MHSFYSEHNPAKLENDSNIDRIVDLALRDGIDALNEKLFRKYRDKIYVHNLSTMYCYISIPPQKRKWFGFFCRDLLLRSLEKAGINEAEITGDSAMFTYRDCLVSFTQDFERSRLEMGVEHNPFTAINILYLCQMLVEAAEGVMSSFQEVKITHVLQGKERQSAATDVLEAARDGKQLVKEWKGDKLCDVDDFWLFLPYYYVDAYLSWDLEPENQASVDTIKQKLEQDDISCWMSLKDRSKNECKRLVDKARTFIVFLTERYLRMLDEDTTVKVECEKVVKPTFQHSKLFVALEPTVLGMEIPARLAEMMSKSRTPKILDFSTAEARNKNFADFVSCARR